MDHVHIFGGLAVVLGLMNAGYSLWLVVTNKTKPHAFSLMVWLIVALITFFNLMEQGAGAAAWRTALTSLASAINLIICLRHGFGYINRFDTGVFIAALLTIPLWMASSPEVSLYWLLLVQLFGGVPTIRKAHAYPKDLSAVVYGNAALCYILQIMALESYSLGMVLYFTLLAIQFAGISLTIYLRKRTAFEGAGA